MQEILVEMYKGVLESHEKQTVVLWYNEVIEPEWASSALESEVKKLMFDAMEKDAKRQGEITLKKHTRVKWSSQYQRKGCCCNWGIRWIENG